MGDDEIGPAAAVPLGAVKLRGKADMSPVGEPGRLRFRRLFRLNSQRAILCESWLAG